MPTAIVPYKPTVALPLLLPVVAGVLLHAYTMVFVAEGGESGFLAGLFLWSCLPYAVASLLPMIRIKLGVSSGFAFGALLGDLFMHYSAFLSPKGSTAALGLLFMPLWNLVLLGPLGAFVAYLLLRIFSSKGQSSTSPGSK